MHLACVSCGFDPQWDPLPPPPQDNISSSDKIAQESVLELLKYSDSHGKPGDQPHQGTCVSMFLTSSQGILRLQAHCPRNTKGTGRCVCVWGGVGLTYTKHQTLQVFYSPITFSVYYEERHQRWGKPRPRPVSGQWEPTASPSAEESTSHPMTQSTMSHSALLLYLIELSYHCKIADKPF